MTHRINISFENLQALPQIHPVLMEVLASLVSEWPIEEVYITSFNRTKFEDNSLGGSGIHSDGPPWRAIDVRIRTLPGDAQAAVEAIAKKVNEKWVYDANRPNLGVCFAHVHGSGPHAHLQVCAATKRR